MATRVISYDFEDDHFEERVKRYKRLDYGDFASLEEAIKARRRYLEEVAARLRVDDLLFVHADGTQEMVSVRGSEVEKSVKELDQVDNADTKKDVEDDS